MVEAGGRGLDWGGDVDVEGDMVWGRGGWGVDMRSRRRWLGRRSSWKLEKHWRN